MHQLTEVKTECTEDQWTRQLNEDRRENQPSASSREQAANTGRDEEHEAVVLDESLLGLTVDLVLGNTPHARNILATLHAGKELERSDYLFMSNLIREPIMRFCEK